jgi:selenocysteine lyase/cysteine desulfurase
MNVEAAREEFPVTRNFNFQNHAAVSPLSRRAAAALMHYAETARDHGYLGESFPKHAARVRALAAKLIGANPDEITFCKNTSEGLSFVANGLQWNTGDNVVLANVEFPANVFPWMNLRARGVRLKMVVEENGRIPLDKMIAAIDQRTRVVTISAVQWLSGFRADLAALGEVCRERGVFLCVDAIQALGAVPLDVGAMHVDFLAADGHKWLCAAEGAGIFYCTKPLLDHLRPSTVGWMSMKETANFGDCVFEFHDDARRFDAGSYNHAGLYALGAAIELILEYGIDQIHARLIELTDRLVQGIRAKGYRITSPRQPGEKSGIVTFFSDAQDLAHIQQHLQREHRIIIALRDDRLRASPHFYNTEEEIDQLIDVLPKH